VSEVGISNAIQRRDERHCVIGDQSLSLRVGKFAARFGYWAVGIEDVISD
jgi:hypothetical protein